MQWTKCPVCGPVYLKRLCNSLKELPEVGPQSHIHIIYIVTVVHTEQKVNMLHG